MDEAKTANARKADAGGKSGAPPAASAAPPAAASAAPPAAASAAPPAAASAAPHTEAGARAQVESRAGRGLGAQRLVSLDVFRGMTVAGMIVVNNPGTWSAVYPPLLHAQWHGWTPTDLVFPFFLFIVGVSLVFSFAARQERGATRRELFPHIVRRSALIFALGLLLHLWPQFDFATLRIPGVLQRIAICYLFAASIYLISGLRGRILTIAGLLFSYWAAMMLIPVPGFGAGNLDAVGNLGAYIDRLLFDGHMWREMWDPEGLLSTVPAIATTLLGVLCGQWLRTDRSRAVKAGGLIAAGTVGLGLGLLWDQWFPINKYIWTSSYVVFTAGFACVVLAVVYWMVDMRGWRWWTTPFLVFGVNALAAYALSSLGASTLGYFETVTAAGTTVSLQGWLFRNLFAPLASPINASLLYAVSYLLLWMAVMWVLYRRKIFIKI